MGENQDWSAAIARLARWCVLHGYGLRMHNHPKTRANWGKLPRKLHA